mmetsp:Transcript_57543/g.106303  ORF Transcript_57543/g.106303 Transcript_57543/m.106303 type:complete len:367 (-) Transcript_57543:61-1161(-)
MGNGRAIPDGPREVILCLQSVHNVPHDSDDVYYGMATDHTSERDSFITSEKPVRFTVDHLTIISVRVFLHKRGSVSKQDRAVGQVSLPIAQVVELIGRGMFQCWLLLEEPTEYSEIRRSWAVEHFRNAYLHVQERIHAPRVCITLLEAETDPKLWANNEKDKAAYHDVILATHVQHAQLVAAYHNELGDATSRSPSIGSVSSLDQVKRRERNDMANISKLEEQMRELREVSDRLWHDRNVVRRKLEAAKWRNSQLQEQASEPSSTDESELAQLSREKMVLSREKAACMQMVQEIFSVAERGAVEHALSPVHAAAASHLLEIRSCGALGLDGALPKAKDNTVGTSRKGVNMLPDPEELIGSLPLDPL